MVKKIYFPRVVVNSRLIDIHYKQIVIAEMTKQKGLKAYKQYWEEQAEFMDKEPWAKDKVIKISLCAKSEERLKKLEFSDHAIDKKNEKLIVRIKIPYNYYELDDLEEKILQLLGIEKEWFIDIGIDNAYCKSTQW